jgi:15-cis-phytoene synthase
MTTVTAPAPSAALTLDEAYRRCASITRTEAKNFWYGIRLLPPAKRRAMEVVYAVARRVDDIGDGDEPAPARRAALDGVEAAIRHVARAGPSADPSDPVLRALGDVLDRFPLPLDAFSELVEGCRRDVGGARHASAEDLVDYCRLVAGSVGRLSLGVFGHRGGHALAERRADALGVALQITNILRDIVEDRDRMGRIYLPAEDIARFGCRPDLRGPEDDVAALVVFEAARAREWYAEGLALLPMLDRRSRTCVAAMAGIYHRLLRRIEHDPAAVLRTRVSVPVAGKLRVAAGALAGRDPR